MKSVLLALSFFVAATGFAAAKIPDEGTHAQIVALMQSRMKVPVLIVGPMAEEGVWILTRWDTGDPGGKGEALAKHSGSAWAVVHSASGSMENAHALVSLGVPTATAQTLVKDMKKL